MSCWRRRKPLHCGQPVNQIHQIVHLFARHLLQSPSLNVEENLIALAQFMVYLQRIEFDLHRYFVQAEQYHQELLSELAAGISLMSQSTPTESVGLKVRALTVLGSLVANKSSRIVLLLMRIERWQCI